MAAPTKKLGGSGGVRRHLPCRFRPQQGSTDEARLGPFATLQSQSATITTLLQYIVIERYNDNLGAFVEWRIRPVTDALTLTQAELSLSTHS